MMSENKNNDKRISSTVGYIFTYLGVRMSFSLAINKNTKNSLFICTAWIKQVDWKFGLCASIFLCAFIFSVYGTLNFLVGLTTVDPKNSLIKELNTLVIYQQKLIEPLYKTEVEAILSAECLYPDNISKTIYNHKVSPMVVGIHSFQT